MADDSREMEDNGLGPWSRHGPDAGRLTAADEFQVLIVLGWTSAASLKLDELLRELVHLHSEALASGVNETHLGRLRSIIDRIAASADGSGKPVPRGRGRPRQLKPSEKDLPILEDIKQRKFEGQRGAILSGEKLDPRRVRQIERAAIRAAIHAAEQRGDLDQDREQRADRVRLRRWRERDLDRLRQMLADAILRGPRSQNGT
jgi:hypothetical protein